jgi:hypothetical protein
MSDDTPDREPDEPTHEDEQLYRDEDEDGGGGDGDRDAPDGAESDGE